MAQDTGNISQTDDLGAWLSRQDKVILVADLVESVRLMELDETGVIARWHAFTRHVSQEILTQTGGRVVKSLGDGLMVECDDARAAVRIAFGMHGWMGRSALPVADGQTLSLRIGVHVAQVFVGETDVYGTGVNLAARIASLAAPGQTVVSAALRDQLADKLDAKIEDLGDCYLKHVQQPVRAYRLEPPDARLGVLTVDAPLAADVAALLPTVAVIPFESRGGDAQLMAVGELIADGVIAQLSLTADLRVISRLSSTGLRGRGATPGDAQVHLGADYVMSGSYVRTGDKLLLMAELARTRDGQVLWARRIQADLADLLQVESQSLHELAALAHDAIMGSEVGKASTQPLPTLASYSLMLGGITLMHRQSPRDFQRSRELLEHLSERHPRVPTPRAWIAKWYGLSSAQGWTPDPRRAARVALDQVKRALDTDPSLSLAWTIKGLIHGYVERDFDAAGEAYGQALRANPNEPLAWLYRATLAAWRGEEDMALDAAQRALRLSPLDPQRYYFDSLAATAMLAGGRHEQAVELCMRSLRANVAHTSTHKGLVIGLALMGRIDEARAAARRLYQLEPGFTVQDFLDRSPLAASPSGQRYRDALVAAGVQLA